MLTTAPCMECAYHSRDYCTDFYSKDDVCSCEKYLDRLEKLKCKRFKNALCTVVRGTRFCDFKPKEGE